MPHRQGIRRGSWMLAVGAGGLALAGLAAASAAPLPAFSGAEGPGAVAIGGRGGDVYHVTNLEFDVGGTRPGSFQYGLRTAPNTGRTIVFDVGGTIYQPGGGSAWWFRSDASNITVAGQTAPGGITIAGVGTKWTGSNVILRNIAVRPNKDPTNPSGATYDGFSLQLKNSIVDHVSTSWYTDEGISITDAGRDSTIQYATIGEGLAYAGHAFGSIIATEVDGAQFSYNHNLYAHNVSRLPAIGSETGQIGAVLSFTNNVIYNWQRTKAGYSATGQHSSSNFVGNYYISGANNGVLIFTGGDDDASAGFTRFFQNKKDPLLANKADYNRDGVRDGVAFGPGDKMPDNQKFFSGAMTFVSTPFAVAGVTAPDTADVALERVTAFAGANWQARNLIDQRIVDSVAAGSGRIINDLAGGPQATEWAAVLAQRPNALGQAPFSRPAGFDTDRDGMPDAWELVRGLDPKVADNNGDFDADGYTNLEEYINQLGAWPAASPILFSGAAGGRYAQIENWDADPGPGTTPWQPSRFDTAVIDSGAVTVDAVGQEAGSIHIGGDAATLRVTSGWLDLADELAVASGGRVVVTGGELLAKQVVINGPDAAVTVGGGTLTIRQRLFSSATGEIRIAEYGTLNLGTGEAGVELDAGLVNDGQLVIDSPDAIVLGRELVGTGTLVKNGFGRLTLSGGATFSGATTIRQGSIELVQAGLLSKSSVTVFPGATLATSTGLQTEVGSLVLADDGRVDVAAGGITVRTGLESESLVAALIKGRGTGHWDGPSGIVSSAIANETTDGVLREVGWVVDPDGAIRIAAAAPGDANLDGVVNAFDLVSLAAIGSFGRGEGSVWATGDFNYDGGTNVLDLVAVGAAGAYGQGGYRAAARPASAVPEPASHWLVGCLLGMLWRAAGGRQVPGAARGTNGAAWPGRGGPPPGRLGIGPPWI